MQWKFNIKVWLHRHWKDEKPEKKTLRDPEKIIANTVYGNLEVSTGHYPTGAPELTLELPKEVRAWKLDSVRNSEPTESSKPPLPGPASL